MSDSNSNVLGDAASIEAAVSAYLTRVLRWLVPLGVAAVVVALVAVSVPSEDERSLASGDSAGGRASSGGLGDQPDPALDGGAATTQDGSREANTPGGSAGESPAGPEAVGVTSSGGTAKSGVECNGNNRQVPWSKYSPPCVGAFSGDNGGATSHGVTSDSIKIVVGFGNAAQNAAIQSLAGPATPNDQAWADTIEAYMNYFNTQFETYGREIVIDTYQMKSDYILADMGRDTAAAQADAQTSYDMGAFVDLTALTNTSSLPYGNALAEKGVISWSFPLRTAEDYAARAPYMYNFLPDGSKWARWATSLVCQRMVGLPAAYAGGDVKGKPRKFGVIGVSIPEWKAAADLTARMLEQECGVKSVQLTYDFDLGTFSQYGASMMAQMNSAGVTTILCVCDPLGPIFMTQSATDDDYFPEWLFHNQGIVGSNYDAKQLVNSFSNGPALPPATETEAFRIFRQAYPGVDPPSRPYFTWIYGIMLQVFSAVQMAGPNLSPTTFQSAMANLPVSLEGGDYGPWWDNGTTPYGGTFTPWTAAQVTRWRFDAPSPDGSDAGYWAPCGGPSFYPFAAKDGWGPSGSQIDC